VKLFINMTNKIKFEFKVTVTILSREGEEVEDRKKRE